MKKITALILTLIILVGTLAACGQSDDNPPADNKTIAQTTSEVKTDAPTEPKVNVTFRTLTGSYREIVKDLGVTIDSYNGDKQITTTIQVTDWIKGDNTELLEAAWKKAQGEGAFPYQKANLKTTQSEKNIAYIVGTVSLRNTDPDWPLDTAIIHINLTQKQDDGAFERAFGCIAAQFSSGMESKDFSKYGGNSEFLAGMEGKEKWGPIAFVIAVPAFSSSDPDGKEFLTDTYVSLVEFNYLNMLQQKNKLSGNAIKLGKTW
ncbi:MAG: hypothetical protein LBN05_04865 [Oscillospiraceae bacterium]|jgi:predicted small lipoprotein YifL|nr:hypothetical protein [Oscillospiraceae bacterium]